MLIRMVYICSMCHTTLTTKRQFANRTLTFTPSRVKNLLYAANGCSTSYLCYYSHPISLNKQILLTNGPSTHK